MSSKVIRFLNKYFYLVDWSAIFTYLLNIYSMILLTVSGSLLCITEYLYLIGQDLDIGSQRKGNEITWRKF